MPRSTPTMSRIAVKAAVWQAVFLSVMGDRRVLGLPERVRDQVVTWAFNAAMDYGRTIRDPSAMVEIDEKADVILDAMEAARDAGVLAFAVCTRV